MRETARVVGVGQGRSVEKFEKMTAIQVRDAKTRSTDWKVKARGRRVNEAGVVVDRTGSRYLDVVELE